LSKRGEMDIWPEKKPSKNKYHPTEKPVPLIRKAIEASSRRGDIILDPFAGSGTTMIAANAIGRVCYSIECEKKYVDVILRRMYMIDPLMPIICNGSAYDKNKLKT
jgi:DNA modification methylase